VNAPAYHALDESLGARVYECGVSEHDPPAVDSPKELTLWETAQLRAAEMRRERLEQDGPSLLDKANAIHVDPPEPEDEAEREAKRVADAERDKQYVAEARSKAVRQMVTGAVALGLSLGATILTYVLATARGGGIYIAFTGGIFFGGIQLFRGYRDYTDTISTDHPDVEDPDASS
jgi:hypothetical protein